MSLPSAFESRNNINAVVESTEWAPSVFTVAQKVYLHLFIPFAEICIYLRLLINDLSERGLTARACTSNKVFVRLKNSFHLCSMNSYKYFGLYGWTSFKTPLKNFMVNFYKLTFNLSSEFFASDKRREASVCVESSDRNFNLAIRFCRNKSSSPIQLCYIRAVDWIVSKVISSQQCSVLFTRLFFNSIANKRLS